MSSGDYPDIIEISDNKLIQAGALVPLDEYINEEDTPNLYKFLEPISKKARYSGDGHVYALPNYGGPIYGEDNTPDYWGPAFWIQKRVLAEYGYPEIKTLDQYFEIIERYVADHPETNGIYQSISRGRSCLMWTKCMRTAWEIWWRCAGAKAPGSC